MPGTLASTPGVAHNCVTPTLRLTHPPQRWRHATVTHHHTPRRGGGPVAHERTAGVVHKRMTPNLQRAHTTNQWQQSRVPATMVMATVSHSGTPPPATMNRGAHYAGKAPS